MNNQSKAFAGSLIIFCLLLSSCGAGQIFGSTVTPTPTITYTPTLTPTATETFMPTVTSTPTATFTPSATQTPAATETAHPLTPEEQAVKDFTDLGVTPDQYTISKDKDGKIQAFYKDTEKVIYKDGKFDYDYTFFMAGQVCESTGIKFKPGTNIPVGDDTILDNYVAGVLYAINYNHSMGSKVSVIPIRTTKDCWILISETHFIFRSKDQVVHYVPVMDINKHYNNMQGHWK